MITSLGSRVKNRLKKNYRLCIARYVLRNSWQELRARLGIKPASGGAYSSSGSPELAAERALRIAREFHTRVRSEYDGPLDQVVEIGPGDSIAMVLLWVGFGAHTALGIDSYADPRSLRKEKEIVRVLLGMVTPEEHRRISKVVNLDGPELRVDESRVRYVGNIPAEKLARRLPGTRANLIFSNAVLEHVRGVRTALQAMHSMLVPGGMMLHKVDLRNHGVLAEFGDTAFLKPSDFLWALMGSASGSFPNRQDVSVYDQALKNCGASCRIQLGWKKSVPKEKDPGSGSQRPPDGFWLVAKRSSDPNETGPK